MAQAYLLPNDDGATVLWTDGTGSAPWYTEIDKGILGGGGPNDADYIENLKTNNEQHHIDFDNVAPGDFGSTVGLDLRIRAQYNASWVDDNDNFNVAVFASGSQVGGTKNIVPTGSWVNTLLQDAAWDSLTKAQLDTLEVRLTYIQSNSGMPDSGMGIQVSEVEFDLEYNVAADTDLTQLTHRTGHRPGPGHGVTRFYREAVDPPPPIPFKIIHKTGHDIGPLAKNETRFARPDEPPPPATDLTGIINRTGHVLRPGQLNETRAVDVTFLPVVQPIPPELIHRTGVALRPGQPNDTRFTRPDEVAPPVPETDLTGIINRTGHDLRAGQRNETRFTRPDLGPDVVLDLTGIINRTGHALRPGQVNETRFIRPLGVAVSFPDEAWWMLVHRTGHARRVDKATRTGFELGTAIAGPPLMDLLTRSGPNAGRGTVVDPATLPSVASTPDAPTRTSSSGGSTKVGV